MTNITPEHIQAFEAIASGRTDNIALFSCFVNGYPAAAIVSVIRDQQGSAQITPLFVSVSAWTHITDHDGITPEALS
jgi:hypothetical protein